MIKKWVDPDDAPALTGEELRRPGGKWRIGGREVSSEEGKAAFRKVLKGKTRVNIHLDNEVILHFRSKAGERGYQTLINAALRKEVASSTQANSEQLNENSIDAERLKNDLLQALRPELQQLARDIAREVVGCSAVQIAGSNNVTALYSTQGGRGVATRVITYGSSGDLIFSAADAVGGHA